MTKADAAPTSLVAWCRGRAGQLAHSVTILHAAIALALCGAGYPAAAIPKRRDVATGRGVAATAGPASSASTAATVIVLITLFSPS